MKRNYKICFLLGALLHIFPSCTREIIPADFKNKYKTALIIDIKKIDTKQQELSTQKQTGKTNLSIAKLKKANSKLKNWLYNAILLQ